MDPFWIYNGTMHTVTLSVKNVPRDVARRLKSRAIRNQRSLQGELLSILIDAADTITVGELATLVKRLGLRTPSESLTMIRDDRDGRRR